MDAGKVQYEVTYETSYDSLGGSKHEYDGDVCLWCGFDKSNAVCKHEHTREVREQVLTPDLPDPLVCGYYRTFEIVEYCTDCGEVISSKLEKTDEYVLASPYHSGTYLVQNQCQYCGILKPDCRHPETSLDMSLGEVTSVKYTPNNEFTHSYERTIYASPARCTLCGFSSNNSHTWRISESVGHRYVNGECADCYYVHTGEVPACGHPGLVAHGETMIHIDGRGEIGCIRYEVVNETYALVNGQQVDCDYCPDCKYAVYQGKSVVDGCVTLTPVGTPDKEFKPHEFVGNECKWCGRQLDPNSCPHTNTRDEHDAEIQEYVYTPNKLGCQFHIRQSMIRRCYDCGKTIDTWMETTEERIHIGSHNPDSSGLCRWCGYDTSDCKHPAENLMIGGGSIEFSEYLVLDEHTHRLVKNLINSDIMCLYCGDDLTNRWKGKITTYTDQPHQFENGKCADCGYVSQEQLPDCAHAHLIRYGAPYKNSQPLDETFCYVHTITSKSYGYVNGEKVNCGYCLDCKYPVYDGKAVPNGKVVLEDVERSEIAHPHTYKNGKCTNCGFSETPVKPESVEIKANSGKEAAIGGVLPLTAAVSPAGAETFLTWSSSDTSIATVDAKGYVTGIAKGTATITVRTSNGKKATVSIKVADLYLPTGIKLDQPSEITINGLNGFTIIATLEPANARSEITWKSSDPDIIEVDEEGFVQPLQEGTATITAKTRNGKTASVKITALDPFKPTSITLNYSGTVTLDRYESLQLIATLQPEIAYSQITWTSSDESIAAVDSNGLVWPQGNKEGTATITATTKHGLKASVTIKVTDVHKPTGITLAETGTVEIGLYDSFLQLTPQLSPADAISQLTWTSSDPDIAWVSAVGSVHPVKEGAVTITAKTHNGLKASVKVKVVDHSRPEKITLDKSGTVQLNRGAILQLNTSLEPAGAQAQLVWRSSNYDVADVSIFGVVTARKEGTATITVETHNGLKDSVKIEVVDNLKPTSLTISGPETIKASIYEDISLTATLNPQPEYYELKWSSSDEEIATVSRGNVTIFKEGTVKITVRYGDLKDTVTINAYDPTPAKKIIIEPEGEHALDMYKDFQLTTRLVPADAKAWIIWSSSDKKIATVSDQGVVHPLRK